MDHTAKQRRSASRRREQDTEVFRDRYKIRGGIEGTNSGLKRKTGLGQLRVRGKPAVYHAIYPKKVVRLETHAEMPAVIITAESYIQFQSSHRLPFNLYT